MERFAPIKYKLNIKEVPCWGNIPPAGGILLQGIIHGKNNKVQPVIGEKNFSGTAAKDDRKG